MNRGYIKLHREILNMEDPIERDIFQLLILKASYKYKTVKLRNEHVELSPGECIISINSLSKSTARSIQQIRTRLNRMELDGKIEIQSTNGWTKIFIVNYAKYQHVENETNNEQRIYNLSSTKKDNIANAKKSGSQFLRKREQIRPRRLTSAKRRDVDYIQKVREAAEKVLELKYLPNTEWEHVLNKLQLSKKIQSYGFETVQKWITYLCEINPGCENIQNPNAYLQDWITNGDKYLEDRRNGCKPAVSGFKKLDFTFSKDSILEDKLSDNDIGNLCDHAEPEKVQENIDLIDKLYLNRSEKICNPGGLVFTAMTQDWIGDYQRGIENDLAKKHVDKVKKMAEAKAIEKMPAPSPRPEAHGVFTDKQIKSSTPQELEQIHKNAQSDYEKRFGEYMDNIKKHKDVSFEFLDRIIRPIAYKFPGSRASYESARWMCAEYITNQLDIHIEKLSKLKGIDLTREIDRIIQSEITRFCHYVNGNKAGAAAEQREPDYRGLFEKDLDDIVSNLPDDLHDMKAANTVKKILLSQHRDGMKVASENARKSVILKEFRELYRIHAS